MPVFHTKTIESILEPVAQQISKLVILQEDSESQTGMPMPDLSLPVEVVKRAADNLIRVGYETCESNVNDQILREEMPPALKRVQEACTSLQQAAQALRLDPFSSIGKRQLIAGERGILQGVSAILFTFDESEVRKIVRTCKQVLEYLSITELIEKMDDLVTYVKNLTPVLTKMTKEVDSREKELTHQVHRELLIEHLEQVKNLTPSFISSIKIYLLTLSQGNMATSSRNNPTRNVIEQIKNYLITCLTHEINEIIRILQLTNYDEEEWLSASPTLYGKIEQANKWFASPLVDDNDVGRQAALMVIGEARKIHEQSLKCSDELSTLIADCESLLGQLLSSSRDEPAALAAIGKNCQDKFNHLGFAIKKVLTQQVADDFLDINHPLRKLADVAISSSRETPNLGEKFRSTANDFLNHTNKLCKTAQQIADCQLHSRNKITELTRRMVELAPQVVNSAYIVFNFPGDSSCLENLELLMQQSQSNMERLQKLVDESLDCELFIRACENSIIKETYETQTAVLENNNSSIISNALNIARRSNRIIQVATQEAENSEDGNFVDRIIYANESLKLALPEMIKGAKSLAMQPNDKESYLVWANANEKLIDAIGKVREAVSCENAFTSEDISARSSLHLSTSTESGSHDISQEVAQDDLTNDLSALRIQEGSFFKATFVSKPTSLPDVVEENESEFPLPQANQPILMAAHDLHININQWYSNDNDMLAIAKRISLLMVRLSELVRGEKGTKKDLIATARQLADDSLEISRIAKLLAQDCTDKRMRMNLLQVSERIPTIGTQLKILSTVKATMLGSGGGEHLVSKEDEEATEMLIVNAQNLNASVKATVQAAKSASIKIRTDSGMKLSWVKKVRKIKSDRS